MASSWKFYVACVPHVPLSRMQSKAQNAALWKEYDARIADLDAFDPDVIVCFGGDHYSHVHLERAPTFMIGHIAEAGDDCGGVPGKLDVPIALSTALADHLVQAGFDMTVSYAMKLDHGFSNALGFFLHGDLASRPVIPIHINTLSDPRPTLKRCRELGEEIGRWAVGAGKKIAFIGSGGLSHQTNFIFPQYHNAPSESVRTFIVHGGDAGEISNAKWHGDIQNSMDKLSDDLVSGAFVAPWINPEWDRAFLDILGGGDLQRFDDWTDAEILGAAGYGGGEVRAWLAAAAAGQSAGASPMVVDYYSGDTTLAVGVGVAHALAVA